MFRSSDPRARKRRLRTMAKQETRFTLREREVAMLVGRDHLSYTKAAAQLKHRHHNDETISPRTVRHYAERIRDMLDSELPPQKALNELYHSSPDLFTDAA